MSQPQEMITAASLAAMLLAWEAARRRVFGQHGAPTVGRQVWLATLAATIFTLVDLGVEAVARRAFPLESLSDALLWFSITPLVAVLGIHALTRNVWPAFALLPLAAFSQISSLFFNDWFAAEAARRALGTTLLGIHVGLFLIGYGTITAAAGLAIVYVIIDHRLKHHTTSNLLPEETVSLDKLDHLMALSVGVSVVLWGLGLGLGAILFGRHLAELRLDVREAFVSDLTVITSFLIWLYFLSFALLRHRLGWVGKRACIVVLAGFVLLLTSYTVSKLQHNAVFHGFSQPHAAQGEMLR